MDLKIRVFLLLFVVGFAVYHVQANKMCDWPRGTCTYYKDPCPPNWERCAQYDYDCPLITNHCCCRRRRLTTTNKRTEHQEDLPMCWGKDQNCYYINDTCPDGMVDCSAKYKCTLGTNKCCCKQDLPMCWGKDQNCYYINDTCPDGMVDCSAKYKCTLGTNKCCCKQVHPTPPPTPPPSPPEKNMCDWPRGTCTYIYDPCPPNWGRCPQFDSHCKVETNHCCCRNPPPKSVQDVSAAIAVSDAPCDWPSGTCTYTGDPCPPTWKRCPEKDIGCKLPTNHCCCRTTPSPPPGKCDWPYGTCTYYKDPCPPNWERCTQFDIDCKLRTNHCCCRKKQLKAVQDASVTCDWPLGTCAYSGEPCPPDMERCSDKDAGCTVATNHCCCFKKRKREPNPVVVKKEYPCDWPVGTCTYIGDSCPPDWHRCSQYDSGCKSPTNHCCCRP